MRLHWWNSSKRSWPWLWVITVLLAGCMAPEPRIEGDLSHIRYKPRAVQLQEPEGFVRMVIPEDNPLTKGGIELGRRLFYDPILSADGKLSCAGCHRPELSFTDGQALSTGITQKAGKRATLPLLNVGYYYKGLFWDGRAGTLEEQALAPVEDPIELGHSWEEVERQLRAHPDYPGWFRKAFGITHSGEIDRYLVAKAIAQFERTLISSNAKYDKVWRKELAFSEEEKRGWTIFFDASNELPKSECGHCHVDPLFTNLDFFNNGIEIAEDLQHFPDPGRGGISGRPYDNGKFRTPTLRNIELTAPYMHDGRFKTLEEVIDHYIAGGHHAENLSPNVRKLDFSERDKKDLIAFLKTLTDTSFVNNPDFSSPF